MITRKIILLLIIFISVLYSCSLDEVFPDRAMLKFKDPMFTPSGRKVKSLNLERGNGYILLNKAPGSSTTSSVTIPAEPRPNKNIRLGGYFFGGFEGENGNMSAEQLKWAADNLDLLALNPHYANPGQTGGITPDQVLLLKQQNSLLKFYCMLFATTFREPLFNPSTMADWVVKDKAGNEALGVRRETNGDTDHLMDLGNKDYAAFFRDFIISHTNQYHADGVAIDEIMWEGYWALDINNMRDYSSVDQIRQSCYDWLEAIKKDNPQNVIHQAFWPEAQKHTNGIWGESAFHWWMRDGEAYKIFYEKMDLKQILESLIEHGKNNEAYIWAAYYGRDKVEQLEYCVAVYLLAKEGNSVVFHPQPTWDGGYPNNLGGYDLSKVIEEYEKHKTLYDVDLGSPLGSYYVEDIGGEIIWTRKFTKGIVYINPN